jgi:uncharacterized protein YjaG (DUF416 family)
MRIPAIDTYENAMRFMENTLQDSAFEKMLKINESVTKTPAIDACQNSIELFETPLHSVIHEKMTGINEAITRLTAIETGQNSLKLLHGSSVKVFKLQNLVIFHTSYALPRFDQISRLTCCSLFDQANLTRLATEIAASSRFLS